MSHCCKKNTGLLLILLLVSILAHFGCANLIDDVIDFFDSNKVIADFGNNFFWGLGTAPTHVEDELDDAWLEFAENDQVAAWKNAKDPEQRLKFWTQPEVELDLAADTGIGVFRLGVDWSRLVPNDPRQFHGHALAPGQGLGRVQNRTALNHYKEIIDMVKERNMDVMLTLFHHSLPKWASDMGGWTSEYMHLFFIDFISDVIDELGDRVKYWNTFNEPTIFVLLTYCNGMWPPGLDLSTSAKLQCLVVPKYGDFAISMSNIEKSHILAYDLIRQKNPTSLIGVAHNVGWHEAYHFWDTASVDLMNSLLSFPFIDHTVEYLDFVGLNYYGKEIHDGAGVVLKDGEEYSESGRTVYPQGLYDLLIDFHERYVEKYPDLKYVITENGISDRTDILRPSYLIEHLLAINKAMADGVNVLGYLHWTISDNWVISYSMWMMTYMSCSIYECIFSNVFNPIGMERWILPEVWNGQSYTRK
jgi:beta-glucosidase/6-phospho-beta-glucosidase/beta-galactosidase